MSDIVGKDKFSLMNMATGAFTCVADYERYAAQHLPKIAYDYYRSGADDEHTLRRNVEAFSRLFIRPRVMINVGNRELRISVLESYPDYRSTMQFPIGIAPTASQRMAHPDGEEASARAACALGTIMIASTIATTSLEDVAKANGDGTRWFQLYVYRDRAATQKLVERVERAGYKALVVTVDAPVAGKRRNDMRNAFSLPPHLRMANFDMADLASDGMRATTPGSSGFSEYVKRLLDPSLSWRDIAWLQSITRLPVMVKGIMTAEDARLAVQHKVAGIFVSNHGARQLDTVPATIEVLPEVVQAVQGKCEVFLDGGVRSGSDVFKALALGAKAVFVGRPVLWGLTQSGETGVKAVLDLLKDELDITMTLAGCPTVKSITTEYVVGEERVSKL